MQVIHGLELGSRPQTKSIPEQKIANTSVPLSLYDLVVELRLLADVTGYIRESVYNIYSRFVRYFA